MPDWLVDRPGPLEGLSIGALAWRLAAAVLLGVAVAATYRRTQTKTGIDAAPLVTTLVLLTVLVAMTTLVIDNSIARAFSLMGALAIVRFRTVVDDARDTTFVVFAVVTGMAVGVDLTICLVGVPIVAATALLLDAWTKRAADAGTERRLALRLGSGAEAETVLAPAFGRHLESWRLLGAVSARQGAALDLRYAVRLRAGAAPLAFMRDVGTLDGVQNVELVGD